MTTLPPPNGDDEKEQLHFYPAWCFPASPTYKHFVKLSALDVHGLNPAERTPHGQQKKLYYHFNHPIRHVGLTGIVVSVEDISAQYALITLDDGSGATIDCKIVCVPTTEGDKVASTSVTTTQVPHLTVTRRLGTFAVHIYDHEVTIGTCLQAKGTLTEFREIRQVALQRVRILHTAVDEARAWKERADFRTRVLSQPWVLSLSRLQRLEEAHEARKAQEQAEREQVLRRAAEQRRRRQSREERRKKHELKKEERLAREEWEMSWGALDRKRPSI